MSFSFSSIGHFFAAMASDIVHGARAAGSVLAKVEKAEPTVEAITGLVFPQAVELERGAFAILGLAASAVQSAGDAASANGVNVTLDAALVADIKAIIPALEQYAKSIGASKPAK
jgi:hypothetical protein